MSEVGNIEVSLVLNGVDSFERDTKNAAKSLGTITLSLDGYANKMNSAASGTQSFLGKMRDYTIVFGGVHRAITLATDAIVALPRSIIENNASLEKNKVLLAGLEKGVSSYAEAQQKASGEMKEVLSISKGMPYSIDAILDSYTKLRVGGVQNTTEAIESLLNTAAKLSATSEQLKHASVAIQQMAGKGVISMEELRGQLGEAIPDAMNIMSRAVGMDMSTMVKVISTGSLESKSALARFFDEMKKENDGAAYAMSTTWIGIMANISKSWEMLVTNNSDGSVMFSNLKGQMNEINNLLKSNEAKRFIQDVDSALSTAISGVSDLAKFAYNNFNAISSAMIGIFAGGRIAGQLETAFGAVRSQIAATSQANSAARAKYAAEIINTKAMMASEMVAHKAMMGTSYAMTQTQIAAEKELHATRMAGYAAEIKASTQASMAITRVSMLTGATNLLKTAVNGVVSAFGGWSTIAITAIVGVIAYIVQATNKTKELNEQLLKSKGFGATQEEMLFAKQKVDEYDKLKKSIAEMEAMRKSAGRLGGITEYAQSDNPFNAQALAAAKERLAVLEKTRKADLETYQNARNSTDEQQRQLATSRFSLDVERRMNEIQSKRTDLLDQQMKQNESIKNAEEKSAKNAADRAAIDERTLSEKTQAVQTILNGYQNEMDKFTQTLDPSGAGLDMSRLTESQREQFNRLAGVIDLTKKKLSELKEEARNATNLPEVKILNQSTNKKTAVDPGQKIEDSLDVQIAKLREKYRALQNNVDAETKSAEIEARIANGDYKGKSQQFIDHLRALAKEYDGMTSKISNYKENAAEVAKVNQSLDNQIMSLTKKAAKSDIDANNPFLQWARSTEGEKEALKERMDDLGKLHELSEAEIKKANDAAELIARIDQNNAHDMISEKDKELTRALASTRQAAEMQHEEELQQLAAFEAAVSKMKDSPARQQMLGEIDTVRQKMNALYEREHDPFKKWLSSAEDLSDGVNNKLVGTFDGLFDGIAEKIVDTTANFGDMIRSLADDLQKYVIKLLMINALKSAIMGTPMGGLFGGGSASTTGYESAGVGATNFSDISQPFQPTTFSGFANGGIMTEFGPAPLRKYANGGIANSPQLAVFGEGSMNEAYVPLPDGRTIPVTMKGQQQQAQSIGVNVNVINQSGIPVDAEQSSAPRFDGENYIIDVVLNAMSRPGRLRTAVKGAK